MMKILLLLPLPKVVFCSSFFPCFVFLFSDGFSSFSVSGHWETWQLSDSQIWKLELSKRIYFPLAEATYYCRKVPHLHFQSLQTRVLQTMCPLCFASTTADTGPTCLSSHPYSILQSKENHSSAPHASICRSDSTL